MAKQRPKRKGIVRFLRALVILLALAAAGLIGWIYLTPMLTADSVVLYDSYTAETGDIRTSLSFSASLDVKKSQTYTASEMSRVKELYVKSGDEVVEDDPLALLSNGELFTAGFDGVVNEIRVSVGDWVRPSFGFLQVCDLVNLEVSMAVDEYDVKSLSVGQSCTVRVISLGLDFETSIAHINRVSSSSGTLAYYTVTCDLTVPAEVLPGMRATVIIPDESAEDVTILSLEALAFDGEDQAYVLRRSADGEYETQYVGTGLSDGIHVEITEGLNAGDTVYAVGGTESRRAAFSLEDIYKSLTGEKVVINAAGGQMRGGLQTYGGFADGVDGAWTTNADGTGFSLPDAETEPGTDAAADTGIPAVTEAELDTETTPDAEIAPDGGTVPDFGAMPEGGTRPDTGSMPERPSTPDTENAQGLQDMQDTQNEQTLNTNTQP